MPLSKGETDRPRDYLRASENLDPHDRDSMLQIAQVHDRAGNSLLACAYYRLAAQAGSTKAAAEIDRQQAYGLITPEERSQADTLAAIFRRHHNRVRNLSHPGGSEAEASTDVGENISKLFAATERSDMAGIRSAVIAGAPVDAKRNGVTPLILASSLGLVESVRTLLELGADPAIQSEANENLIPLDFARHQANLEIEMLLAAVERGAETRTTAVANALRCTCGTCRDLAQFLDHADLVLPKAGWEYYKERMRREANEEVARKAEQELERLNYRPLFEQLFGSEALACANAAGANYSTIRAPMDLGSYEVNYSKRMNVDLVKRLHGNFEAADQILKSLLPDEIFTAPPRRVCEIGGAWGGTIKHFMDRFAIEEYQNYEPDRYYADWTFERFGAKKMPVDGETLGGTETDSMDVVIANNVFIIVPPLKIWSYLIEMRRVVRKNGLVVFSGIVSDQVTEDFFWNYLCGYFPRRTFQIIPRDVIDRTFAPPAFELLKIVNREYFVFRRVERWEP